jgi:serpin B
MIRATHTLPLLLLTLASFGGAACSSASKGAPESPADAGSPDASGPSVDGAASGTVVRASEPRSPAVASDVATAVDANNAFAIDLYGKASPSAKGGNFLTSPISATLALTMTYAGAQGTTATQMASVLHIPSGGPSIFAAQNALSQALDGRAASALTADTQARMESGQAAPSADDYEVQVVNSVWGQKGYPWDSPFLTILAESYGTGVYVEDFETDPAAGESAINQWVSTATAGKIDPLLPPNALDTTTRMVLVNAIHLKLPWASGFDASATQPATFTRGDMSTVQADFMNQEYSEDGPGVGYLETDAAQFVSVPLAGGQLSVVFALPKGDLATFTSSLTKDSFAGTTGVSDLILSVPKFSFTSPTFSLAAPLKALGMTEAFDRANADFKGICAKTPDGQNLYISDVLQKATLDVAEHGVEAAAATAVVVDTDAASDGDAGGPITVTLDRPFVVSIVDASGAILFLGQIDDPTSSGG